MRKRNTSGVYAIINKISGKIYIGSSYSLEARKARHYNELRRKIHRNVHLQNAFNKYGEKNLEWKILKLCKKENLLKEEQILMYKYNCTNRDCGYNIMLKSNCSIVSEETRLKLSKMRKGKPSSRRGVKLSEETKKKLSDSHRGFKHSEETKEKMSLRMIGNTYGKGKFMFKKYCQLLPEWIKLRIDGVGHTKIAKLYNISPNTVRRYFDREFKVLLNEYM